jgi:hypothetical protein
VLACLPVLASPGSQCVLLAHHCLQHSIVHGRCKWHTTLKGGCRSRSAAAPAQRRAATASTPPDDCPRRHPLWQLRWAPSTSWCYVVWMGLLQRPHVKGTGHFCGAWDVVPDLGATTVVVCSVVRVPLAGRRWPDQLSCDMQAPCPASVPNGATQGMLSRLAQSCPQPAGSRPGCQPARAGHTDCAGQPQ